jgi:NAD(P)-dependent dehydrogenase (short-subunit alcohol dehydrogenase family)
MNGKIVLITGANSGLGFETARQLSQRGARIVMICRDRARGLAAQNEIARVASGAAPDLLLADLSSQASIQEVAQEIRSRYSRLDVLIHNAGAIFERRELTIDGIERTFAVNHLASFLLTRLIFDLVSAAPAGRVITVSSEIHSGKLDFDNLQGERHYNFLQAYYQSKLENILFSYELARRARHTGVTVNSLSPGPTLTHFGDNLRGPQSLFPLFMKHIPFLFVSPTRGARTAVYLASSEEVAGLSGQFFMHERLMRTKPISYDGDVAKRLWDVSERLTSGVREAHGWALTLDRSVTA